ncbi:MAG: transglycosylase domain-containing protein, partial [Clostridia bacterium]|nr:transglycosylase domain-containing protein [Clostridia bacterium]
MKTYQKVLIGLVGIVFAFLLSVGIFVLTTASTARLDESKLRAPNRSVRMVASDGTDISGLGGYVEYEEIPIDLVNAFVAVEDKRYWDHNGLDFRRMVGATLANVKSRSVAQGASTITCQLVKNTQLDNSKTLTRKIKEAKMALEVEKEYSKEEIMEMYLNVIYFGQGLYGVGAAAQGFYGVKPAQLSLAQCASIAATVVNPSKYSPRLSPDNNRTRRNLVLDLMRQQGYIDEESCLAAKDVPIELVDETPDPYRSYRTNALQEAAQVTGIDAVHLIGGGYVIHTYCDPALQRRADGLYRQDLLSRALDGKTPDSM